MKMQQLKFSAILWLSLSIAGLQAQECVNATGGNVTSNEGAVSYSVGQIVYQVHTDTYGSLTQGVQQAYEISETTGIKGPENTNFSITAYPNPSSDYLTLDVKDFDLSSLSLQLYDINGQVLQNQKITSQKTSIVTSLLLPATYFVKISKNGKEIKTFKIIKN